MRWIRWKSRNWWKGDRWKKRWRKRGKFKNWRRNGKRGARRAGGWNWWGREEGRWGQEWGWKEGREGYRVGKSD